MTTFIRFWWHGYSPEDFLNTFDHLSIFEVSTNNHTWRLPKPGTDILTVQEWMTENDKQVVNTKLTSQRRVGGRWQGQYILAIRGAK